MVCKDDGYGVIWSVISSMNIKIAFLLFISYIILNTDIFTENILYNISNEAFDKKNMKVSNKGFVITGLILIIIYLFIDLADKGGIL